MLKNIIAVALLLPLPFSAHAEYCNFENIPPWVMFADNRANPSNEDYVIGRHYYEMSISPNCSKQEKETLKKKAIDMLELAGARHLKASLLLTKIFSNDKKPNIALFWLKNSASLGDKAAQLQLAEIYLTENPETTSPREIIQLLKSASEPNFEIRLQDLLPSSETTEEVSENTHLETNKAAQYQLGLIYLEGRIARYSNEKALEYFGLSCDNGHIGACLKYKNLVTK